MKPQNNARLFEVFAHLGITYSKNLRFDKARYQQAFLRVWEKNRDPTKRFLSFCFDQEILEGKHPKICLKKSTRCKGYGVFLDEKSLGKHAYVGEYTGLVRKGSLRTFFSPYSVTYPTPFSSFRGFVIDAQTQGNFTRFINHASNPTVEMKSVLCSDGLIHMIFVTKRTIEQGEEITLNYGNIFAKLRWRNK